jgi:hypothetical protein
MLRKTWNTKNSVNAKEEQKKNRIGRINGQQIVR